MIKSLRLKLFIECCAWFLLIITLAIRDFLYWQKVGEKRQMASNCPQRGRFNHAKHLKILGAVFEGWLKWAQPFRPIWAAVKSPKFRFLSFWSLIESALQLWFQAFIAKVSFLKLLVISTENSKSKNHHLVMLSFVIMIAHKLNIAG